MARVTLKAVQKIYPLEEGRKARKTDPASSEREKSFQYTDKGFIAVHDFNLDIEDKEFVVLVGPSGCGKSTTLRMIAGLEEITAGELYIGDKLVNEMAAKDRDIAMVFQSYALYPHMTVYDNMAFALKLRRLPKDEIDQAVREAAEILDITEYLRRKPKALSGGQRQRVAIGRAIVRRPQVFLMDEPLSNLDAKLRNQMRAEIIKLRQKVDTTFIYVTHDQVEAMTLGDRIVIMKDGLIQQVGTPQDVFDHPANQFVAGFIGSPQMNFFEVSLDARDDRYFITIDGKEITLCDDMQQVFQASGEKRKEVILGIRPEHISLANESEAHMRAFVDVSEMMGSSIHLHANRDKKPLVAIIPDQGWSHRSSFNFGTSVFFTFDTEVIHLFDKDTGASLLS